MNIQIKRIDENQEIPKYETSGASGFDLSARKTVTIVPNGIGMISVNTVIKTPKDHTLMVLLRSSTPRKYGLLMPHGAGIIDSDYCGNEDEIKVLVYNFRNQSVTIEKGTRIAQGVFVKIGRANWVPVENMQQESRGGFGSTDKNDA